MCVCTTLHGSRGAAFVYLLLFALKEFTHLCFRNGSFINSNEQAFFAGYTNKKSAMPCICYKKVELVNLRYFICLIIKILSMPRSTLHT